MLRMLFLSIISEIVRLLFPIIRGFFLCEGSRTHRPLLEANVVAKAGLRMVGILPTSRFLSLKNLSLQLSNRLPRRQIFVHLRTLVHSPLFRVFLTLYLRMLIHRSFSLIPPQFATSSNVRSNSLIVTSPLSIRFRCDRISTKRLSSISMKPSLSDVAVVYRYLTVNIQRLEM